MNPLYGDFTGGELSPRLNGRPTAPIYQKGAQTMENFLLTEQGNLERRPGTVYVNGCKSNSTRSRLIPYEFRGTSFYVIEIAVGYIRVYKSDPAGTRARLGTVELGSIPWSEAELREVMWAQYGDKMYFSHDGYQPYELFRDPTTETTWTFQAISFTTSPWSSGDYPAGVAFHETRSGWCGSKPKPQKVWLSKSWDTATGSEQHTVFTLPTGTPVDNDPIFFPVGSERASKMVWLVSRYALIAGGTNGLFVLEGGETGMTPAKTNGHLRTYEGAAKIQPKGIGNAILFVQAGGSKLREYIVGESDWMTGDLTLFAEHIGKMEFKEIEACYSPDPALWCVLGTGQIGVLTYYREEGIVGWQRIITDGEIESVCKVRHNQEDELWIAVKRTINGATARYIEYFSPRDWGDDDTDICFVDSAKWYDNGAEKTVGGISMLKPMHVDSTSHGFNNGDKVQFVGTEGSEWINGQVFTVTGSATNDFDLLSEDGSAQVDGTIMLVTLSAAPATPWADGTLITGVTSGKTATTVSKLSDTEYYMTGMAYADTFTAGESLGYGGNNGTFSSQERMYDAWTAGGTVQKVQKVLTGLSHLEGKELAILGDGARIPPVTVASGSATMDRYANKIVVGLNYDSILKLMPIEVAFGQGSSAGMRKRIDSVLLKLFESLGGGVGPDDDTIEPIPYRTTDDELGEPLALFTGDKEISFSGDYDTTGSLVVVASDPFPFTVLSITPRLEVYD